MLRLSTALLTAMLATVLTPSAASADPILECDGADRVEIRECLQDTLARADAAVQVALTRAQTAAAEQDEASELDLVAPALEASQAAWEAYRDSQCDYIAWTFGGGTGAWPVVLACRITAARSRATELLGGLH